MARSLVGMKRIFPFLFVVLTCSDLSAQLGGNSIYSFMDIPSSARVASLGGSAIATSDGDLNLAIYNPSLLNAETHNQLVLSYVDYFSDINFGFVSYARHFDSIPATFATTLQFVDYGKFTETDQTGQELGSFNAGDYVLNLAGSYAFDTLFTVGANLKFIYSNLADYNSFGAAVDLAGTYSNKHSGWTASAVLRNIGYQFKTYTSGEREDLAFQAQFGVTKKFRHAPFRLGIVAENLQKWDLTYDDPNAPVTIDPTTGEVVTENKDGFFEQTMRHLIFNVEIMLIKSFHVRVGYNYRRHQEMKINEKPGTAGLTWGAGLRLRKFQLSYGRATYHQVGASNHFTVALKLAEFGKKREPREPRPPREERNKE